MKPFIGMIAGGTGITPMYQVIREVLGNEEDKTRLTLIYANRSEKDILLKAELDQLQAWYPRRFQVHYVVEHAEDEATFDGFTGFVTTDVAKKVRCRLAHRGARVVLASRDTARSSAPRTDVFNCRVRARPSICATLCLAMPPAPPAAPSAADGRHADSRLRPAGHDELCFWGQGRRLHAGQGRCGAQGARVRRAHGVQVLKT